MECGLSSPPEGGATTWLTWGYHHNMVEGFLEGVGKIVKIFLDCFVSYRKTHQWGGQNRLLPLKCPFE